jgi:hypothetical protein
MKTDGREPAPIVLPWTFDTTSVWHTILKGAFALNAILVVGILVKVLMRQWLDAVGVGVSEVVTAGFTVIFLRYQEGSRGTVFPDRVEIEPNAVLGVPLPGPRGVYPLSRFRSVQVEFRPGAASASPNAAGPHELVWLLGAPGIPSVVLGRTRDGGGRILGRQLGALFGVPVEEIGAPREIRL